MAPLVVGPDRRTGQQAQLDQRRGEQVSLALMVSQRARSSYIVDISYLKVSIEILEVYMVTCPDPVANTIRQSSISATMFLLVEFERQG